MTKVIEIQRKNPYSAKIRFKSGDTAFDINGITVLFTVKLLSDTADNDDAAIIKQVITNHSDPQNGETVLELSASETTQQAGRYKADFRLYLDGVLQKNTSMFYIDFVDIVTKRIPEE